MVAIGAAWLIGQAIPLGWDESVYASKSRSLLDGHPVIDVGDLPCAWAAGRRAAGWGVRVHGREPSRRGAAAEFRGPDDGVGVRSHRCGVPWLRSSRCSRSSGRRSSSPSSRCSTRICPSAGLLLALMLLVWFEFERRPEPSRLLIAAAPLAALAFYIRYGSILPIGGIGIAAVVLWHRSMLRNKGLVGLTVAFAALLFAPHVLEAISRTGSPLGIITSAGEQVDTSEPIATAARYLGWLPAQLAHRLGFVVMLAGVVHAAIVAIDAIRRRELGPAARRYLWLFVPAGVTTVGLILQSHPEQRYVLFPILLAIIAGAGAISAAVAWLRARPGLADRQRTLDGAIVVGMCSSCRHRGIGRGAPPRRARARGRRFAMASPPSDGPSMRMREGPVSWSPRSRRSSSGTRAVRGQPVHAPVARRPWERVARSRADVHRLLGHRRAPGVARTLQRYRDAAGSHLRPCDIPMDGVRAGVEVYRLAP